MLNSSNFDDCLSALRAAGLVLGEVIADGNIHRCPTTSKPSNNNGWYIAHAVPFQYVCYGDWATGEKNSWTARKVSSSSQKEKEEFNRCVELAKRAYQSEKKVIEKQAQEKAIYIYHKATDCFSHQYLTDKGVQAVPGLKLDPSGRYPSLIVPVKDEEGILHSLQFIQGNGEKRFLLNGRVKDGFFSIGGDSNCPLIICEGLATGLSLHMCVGNAVWVAFNAGNLLPVATIARRLFPAREIIMAADNDLETKGNPGVTAANKAAMAIGAKIAIPHKGDKEADWNDIHQFLGADSVKDQFAQCKLPERVASCVEQLPLGFQLRQNGHLPGLWHVEPKDNGDPVETWIGGPLYILGSTRDENSNAWGLLLQWEDPDGRIHTWAMPKALLTGRDSSVWVSRLVDEGWKAAHGTNARNKLSLYLSSSSPTKRIRCVDRTGWHNGAYVFPDTTMTPCVSANSDVSDSHDGEGEKPESGKSGEAGLSDQEQIVLQAKSAINPFKMAGSLEDWQDSIGKWSRGNSRIMHALSASLASVLLEVSGQESGGFNYVGGSSTGKTTALEAAGSMWGKGTSSGGYILNWRATSNGLEGIAELHSDALLCLDEIGQAPGRTIFEATYMLANGMGKTRGTASGGHKNPKTWRIMVLSSGEKGLVDKIAEEGGKIQAGQLVRLVDIPADTGSGFGIFEDLHGHESARAFAEAFKVAAKTNYGHAARKFISQYLLNPTAAKEISEFLANGVAELCPTQATSQVQRVAKRFLLCIAAGEMASEWGILPWEKGEAFMATKKCFDSWLAFRGGTEDFEDTNIMEQIMLFIEQHGYSRFQDLDNPVSVCINRVGFRKKTDEGTEYMILPESFKAEVCKGLSATRALKVLLEKGLLIPGEGRNLARKSPSDLPGLGRKRCYTILIKNDPADVA